MGQRSLTPRQRKFAELLASGSSKTESFRAAYPSNGRSKGTEWQGGQRVARLPQVRAEVERLTLLRSPHDAGAQTQHIQARLIELTKNADPAIALRAIAQWGKLAGAGLLKPPPIAARVESERPPSADERRRLIDELRAIYDKALPRKETLIGPLDRPLPEPPERHSLVVDADPGEEVTTVLAEPSERKVLLSVSPPSSNDDFEITTVNGDDTARAFGVDAVADESAEDWETVPGCFPPKYRRVQRTR